MLRFTCVCVASSSFANSDGTKLPFNILDDSGLKISSQGTWDPVAVVPPLPPKKRNKPVGIVAPFNAQQDVSIMCLVLKILLI